MRRIAEGAAVDGCFGRVVQAAELGAVRRQTVERQSRGLSLEQFVHAHHPPCPRADLLQRYEAPVAQTQTFMAGGRGGHPDQSLDHALNATYGVVATPEGTIVLASDNAYLYENLDQRRPIAQTLDSLSNLRAQDRMKMLASSPRLIVPGHDPEVFTRFAAKGEHAPKVVLIR